MGWNVAMLTVSSCKTSIRLVFAQDGPSTPAAKQLYPDFLAQSYESNID